VVGNDVEHLTESCIAQRCAELSVTFGTAKLTVDLLGIDDVVAMRAAGRGLKIGRGVEMTDAQLS
jgi:hypothetical protein